MCKSLDMKGELSPNNKSAIFQTIMLGSSVKEVAYLNHFSIN